LLPCSPAPLLFVGNGNGDGYGNGFSLCLLFSIESDDRGVLAEDIADRYVDLGDRAGGGRGDFDRGLLGFDLDEALIDRDGVADRHQNSDHIDAVDAFSKFGEVDCRARHHPLLRP
jgi:hypothetical protein